MYDKYFMFIKRIGAGLDKKQFLYSTTVHKDVTERLEKINPNLAGEARQVLEVNKSERHIRGGLATKEKYLGLSGSINHKIIK